ncbi:hypothetical protein QAD02_021592 [Eretmocerus hayati]|uniref:Uncharacterized protein n=1 Tax=Eretmocerus hayati TaxID=131215 RepID=A0ACC2PR56_9HYME|nr:hypothetical protein QAD02_021592 [Eretmocerus hayati]
MQNLHSRRVQEDVIKKNTLGLRERRRSRTEAIPQVKIGESKQQYECHGRGRVGEERNFSKNDLQSGKKEGVEQEGVIPVGQNEEADGKGTLVNRGVKDPLDDSSQGEPNARNNTLLETPNRPAEKRGRPTKWKSSLEGMEGLNTGDRKDGSSFKNLAKLRKRGRPRRQKSVNDDAFPSPSSADEVEKNLESMFEET